MFIMVICCTVTPIFIILNELIISKWVSGCQNSRILPPKILPPVYNFRRILGVKIRGFWPSKSFILSIIFEGFWGSKSADSEWWLASGSWVLNHTALYLALLIFEIDNQNIIAVCPRRRFFIFVLFNLSKQSFKFYNSCRYNSKTYSNDGGY